MKWTAHAGKDSASATLERSLWDAADQFLANSGLKAQICFSANSKSVTEILES